MNQVYSAVIVFGVIVALTAGAMMFSNNVATDGLAKLNEKYEGKCVSVGQGVSAKIIAIRPKEIRLAVKSADGSESIATIPRAPLDGFIVGCPS